MNRINSIAKRAAAIISLSVLFGLMYAPVTNADVIGDSKWQVESGDNVYSIARKMFPDNNAKQSQFRKELVKSNPDIFRGNANLMSVGSVLQLPGFAIAKPVTAIRPETTTPIVQQLAKQPQPVTVPDPEEVIGKVVVSSGIMEAENRGSLRKIGRNSQILKGDTLITGSNSYTQIRMIDGALISLRPDTRLLISDYNFNGREDGSEKSFMELVSGGFRTVTGLIGHVNKNNYRVRTSVATIGIRGTHYGLMVCADGSCEGEDVALKDGLYGGVVDGSIVVQNDQGEVTFTNDQYFHVASAMAIPIEQLKPPPVFHGRKEVRLTRAQQEANNRLQFENADNKDGLDANGKFDNTDENPRPFLATLDGIGKVFQPERDPLRNDVPVLADQNDNPLNNTPIVNVAPIGSAMLIAFLGQDPVTTAKDNVTAGIRIGVNNVNEIVLGSKTDVAGITVKNIPVFAREISNGDLHTIKLPSGTMGVSDMGGNSLGVNWGRWSTNFEQTENGAAQPVFGNLHYIFSDKLTTVSELTALGGLFTTAKFYSFAGGTAPTDAAGGPANLNSITATADFQTSTMTDYQLQLQDGVGNIFNMVNDAPVAFADMHEFNLIDAGTSCTVACVGSASAAFVGSQAKGMMTSYSVSDTSGAGVNGVAFLIRP